MNNTFATELMGILLKGAIDMVREISNDTEFTKQMILASEINKMDKLEGVELQEALEQYGQLRRKLYEE